MKLVQVAVLIALVLVTGCVPPPNRPTPVRGDVNKPVVKPNQAAAAMRKLATDRADNWSKIVAKVRSREIKTVAELAAESMKCDELASDSFSDSMTAYLKELLNSADGDLPDNAADVLEAVPKGFQEALR